jgi:hypothetical protein
VQELALNNLRGAITPLMQVAKAARPGSIGQLAGDTYIPSRLALLDTWSPLAEAQGGKLIVVAPATDAVFYVSDDSPRALDALRTLAHSVMGKAPHPLTDILLRWKPTGWEIVRGHSGAQPGAASRPRKTTACHRQAGGAISPRFGVADRPPETERPSGRASNA